MRLLVCLSLNCVAFFLFAFVSSLCTTVLIRIYHHSTLCLFEMKACWGGSGFSFQRADVVPSSADDTIGVKRGLFLVNVI